MRQLKLLIFCCTIFIVNATAPIAESPSGKYRGRFQTSRSGRKYAAFMGIRYGTAKRFEVAEKPPASNDVIDTNNFGPQCAQYDPFQDTMWGEEDCLFLVSHSSKFPTMIWIHGGGFALGSANNFSANYILDEDVVLITVNYRLGVFGFLDTQDGCVTGNQGLRDQRLAINWVSKNIQWFGGDPGKITLFGSSAGAASVSLHLLTETSELFHRAISQSSTAASSWLLQRTPKENAIRVGKNVCCGSTACSGFLQCMQSKSTKEILEGVRQIKLGTKFSTVNFLFTPSIEQNDSHGFLRECPNSVMKKRKKSAIPWMVGFCKDDGLFNLFSIYGKKDTMDELLQDWRVHAPWFFVFNSDVLDEKQRDEISDAIRAKYLVLPNGKADTSQFWENFVQLIGDRWEGTGTIESIKELHDKIPIYPYVFSYVGNFSYSNVEGNPLMRNAVGHQDELQYLFEGAYDAPSYNADDTISDFSRKFVKSYVQFAKTGTPETNDFKGWKQAMIGNLELYDILDYGADADSKYISVDKEYKSRMEFWKRLLPSSCPLRNTKYNHIQDEL